MLPAFVAVLLLPPKALSANGSHGKPAAISRIRTDYKKDCQKRIAAQMLEQGHPGFLCAEVKAEWFMGKDPLRKGRYRPLDEDNARAAQKYMIDGAVLAGVVPFDDHKTLKHGECSLYRSAKEHKGRSCVVLTFTSREDAVAE